MNHPYRSHEIRVPNIFQKYGCKLGFHDLRFDTLPEEWIWSDLDLLKISCMLCNRNFRFDQCSADDKFNILFLISKQMNKKTNE